MHDSMTRRTFHHDNSLSSFIKKNTLIYFMVEFYRRAVNPDLSDDRYNIPLSLAIKPLSA